jgi:hypothetical protein
MIDFTLQGKGLNPGQYDFIIDNLHGYGCCIDVGKDIPIRIFLDKKTTWEDILNLLPKGSLIKKIRHTR